MKPEEIIEAFIRQQPADAQPITQEQALEALRHFAYQRVDTPEADRIGEALRQWFPEQIDCGRGMSVLINDVYYRLITFGLGYQIPFAQRIEGKGLSVDEACVRLADAFIEELEQSQAGQGQRVLYWRERPNFATYPDFETRAINVALWARYTYEGAAQEQEELAPIKYLPTDPAE